MEKDKEEFIYASTDNIKIENSKDEKIVKSSEYLIGIASIGLLLATTHDFYEQINNPSNIKYNHRYRYLFKGMLFLVLTLAIIILPNKDLDLKLLMGLAAWYSFRYLLLYSFVIVRDKTEKK